MKTWVIRALFGLVAVVAGAAAIGWFLPVAHTASVSRHIARPPADVFALVSDVPGYPRWWTEMERVEPLPLVDGRPRFREHMSTGPVVFEITAADPPRRFVSTIADPDQPFGGSWTFELAAADGGTRITITEDGEVYNPLFRFLSRFVFSQTATLESFAAALEAALTRPAP